jgi:hypothetical protein
MDLKGRDQGVPLFFSFLSGGQGRYGGYSV